MIPIKKVSAAALTAFLLASFASGPVWAQAVTVVVNGAPVSFDQPPVERAGRVFVPLRGVFERLGATVVYANGDINATGNGRNIHLHIGSTQAVVDGQTLTMDVAPFLIGARTLIPLRFVAQALGAAVNWSAANNTVYIRGNGNVPGVPINSAFSLGNMRPSPSTGTVTPLIRATFSEPVDTTTVRIFLDGRSLTAIANITSTGFSVRSNFSLASGTHTVHVAGRTQTGARFSTGWTFTTRF